LEIEGKLKKKVKQILFGITAEKGELKVEEK
jgi:hypothetical protein